MKSRMISNHTSQDRNKFSGHHHILHKKFASQVHQSLNIVITKRVQIEVAEAICSKPHTLTRSSNTVLANDHLQQKHQTRRKE